LSKVIKADRIIRAETPPEKKPPAPPKNRDTGAGDRAGGERAAERAEHIDITAPPSREVLDTIPPDSDTGAAYDELLVAAQEEVAHILADAREQAARELERARDEAERMRGGAVSEGFNQGRQDARLEVADILEQARARAQDVMTKAEQERREIIAAAEPKLYNLALDIAEKILRIELDRSDEAYMSLLGAALSRVKADGTVTVRVGAEDFTRYFDSKDKARLQTDTGIVEADVRVDLSVESGGCLIETESGVVDATVTTQIAQIAKGLGIGGE
jgi:flagellar assembly protein FliH